jgi:hypothetical protein
MAGEEGPCLAAPALSLPPLPCSARGDDRSREGEPSDTSRSERLRTVPSVAGRRNWILELARHYAHVRSAHPTDRLLLVFEIDGPIVDQRHIVRRRLLDYDRVHGSNHFSGVELAEVDVDAGNLERFITRRGLPATGARELLDRCRKRLRRRARARHGASLTRRIRGDPLVPAPAVHLRRAPHEPPERLRADTLHSLNALGRHVRVQFHDDLLHMTQSGDQGDAVASKIEGLRAFTRAGYRPVAFVDHEPSVLHGVFEADETRDVLFLQTRTTSGSPRLTGPRTAAGRHFDLRALIAENDLPDQVQLVWHGVNDEANLREFLFSRVAWGECDLRRDPRQRLVLRHDSFEQTPWTRNEAPLTPATAPEAFARHARALKLDLKDRPGVLDEVLALVI